jgi:hypothetical protein
MDEAKQALLTASEPVKMPPLSEDCQCVNGGTCQRCYDDIWDTIGKGPKE